MSDAGAMVANEVTFSSLVREAFIDPIRSVLIIDDQYPTWEQIFGEEGYDPNDISGRWAVRSQIFEVIKQFRVKSPALTVDIHDGSVTEGIESYLHQSDLLVLDYQLEKVEPHGVRAAGIIDKLLSNSHFNLVVVHTAIGDLVEPFVTILLSLLTPVGLDGDSIQEGKSLVEAYEESEHNDADTIVDKLRAAVTLTQYIAFRKWLVEGKRPKDFVVLSPSLADFRAIAEKAGWNIPAREKVCHWAISDMDKRATSSSAAPRDLRWNSPTESGQPWIRTSGGFIAFADKNNTDLLTILAQALEDWKPSPSRMISSKIRAEISAQGVVAEDTALSDRHAYWQYYQELRKASRAGSASDKNHRKTLIEAHATRHTERLFDLIGGKAIEFGLKVIECDPTEKDAAAAGFAAHYSVDTTREGETGKALSHYNAHISTKPVSGWHLQPGHIFKVDNDIWVCVSPACDLVPKQKGSAAVNQSIAASTKPFMAVKLHPRQNSTRAEINSNTLVFLKDSVNGNVDIKTYSVFPNEGEFGSPIWRLFMAADFGKINVMENKTAELRLSYLCGKTNSLKIEYCSGLITGQLRYEYALNLIQKLGTELTRIGLDFVPPN